jgi:hypothetical protein
MKTSTTILAATALLALAGTAMGATAPDGKGGGIIGAPLAKPPLNLNIKYHGGPLLNDPKGANVYYIWYGDWSNDTGPTILTKMMKNVSGSSWNNINTTYYSGSTTKVYVPNRINFKGWTKDDYSQGTALSDAQIQQVVATAIANGSLPSDTNALYFVLTSKDVTATSGFCSAYCGWHNHAAINGSDIKYSFVGNAASQCPTGCIAPENQAASPNNNIGADGMASVMMHELVETVSDPDLNAWSDIIGQENADKCAWTFGTTTTLANGSVYNVNFGAGKFLIQQNWSAAAPQGCLQGL